MSVNNLSKIPYWDGKAKSFSIYISKIQAYAEFIGVGDALDPVLMENNPTRSQFVAVDVTNSDNLT
jgi:hypothetical protein